MEGITEDESRFHRFGKNFVRRLNPKPALKLFAIRQYVAEFFATGFFVFAATGSAIAAQAAGGLADPISNLIIALAFGFAIAAMVYATANVSGGHLNPAVTIALAVTGNKNLIKAVFYIIAQMLGAIVGSAFLRAITPHTAWGPTNLGSTSLGPGMNPCMGFWFEFIITFALLFTVFGTVQTDNSANSMGKLAGLAIGLSIFMGHIVGKPFTGPSMNPARTFGPYLASGFWPGHAWIYFAGPIAGAITAAVLYQFVLTPAKTEPSPGNEEREAERQENIAETKQGVEMATVNHDPTTPNPV